MLKPNHNSVLISFDFKIASEKDMERLGRAFAEVVLLSNLGVERSVSIGLVGETSAGKSLFSKGLINRFVSVDIETLNREPYESYSEESGAIVHYDELDDPEYSQKVINENEQSVILVEHADESVLDFNYWVTLNINSDDSRTVSIEIPEDEVEEQHVTAFVQKAQKFAMG